MAKAVDDPFLNAAPLAGPVEAWPMVGRERELEAALASLADARGSVLVGEPGTGKTRLAAEVARTTAGDGRRWHVVMGSQGAARVPLGAWAHLLPDAWEPGADDLATWRSLAAGLQADGQPVHLLVDDAQWLDAVSAGLVHHLVTTGRARAILTVRAGVPLPQPVTALWKDGHLQRQDLDPLDPGQTAALLEAALGAPVEPRTARALWQRSSGNLLMLRELVDAGRADDTLRLRHGAWLQARGAGPSPRLLDLLADRVEALDPAERAGAELVAVAEPIDAEVLNDALGADLVRRLVSERVVVIERSGRSGVVRSAHPLVAEVLVARMDAIRAGEIVRGLAERLGSRPSITDTDQMRLAVWRLEAGVPIDGAEALRASELALARSDAGLAEALAGVALEEGQGPAATIALGEALHRQQRSAEAEALLAPVGDRLKDLEPSLRLRYAEARALALSTDVGRLDEAITVLERTLETMPEGRPRSALEARLAFVLSDCGRLRAATPYAEACLARREQDEVAALSALTAGTLVRTLSGRGRDALALCDAMVPVALAHQKDLPAGLGWITAQRMLALYFLGELAEAESLSAAVDALLVDDPDPSRRAAVLMVRGLVAADAGRLDDALRLLRQSAALHELDNHRGYRSWTFAILARVHAQRGEVPEAVAALDRARKALWPGGQVFASDLDAAAMWVEAARDRPEEARRIAAAAILRADAEGETMVSAHLRHEAVRVGLPVAEHLDALAAAATLDQGARAAIWFDHAVAVSADDGPGLEAAGHRLVELGTHLVAAEAFARAAGIHQRRGDAAAATQANELSRRELSRCPGGRTPALLAAEPAVGLTDRELVVARRAAAGMSNLEIAADLGVSVRTVETHLRRTFLKLGVHKRSALVALVGAD